jgi:hypothetical protein
MGKNTDFTHFPLSPIQGDLSEAIKGLVHALFYVLYIIV